jgi:hypothetical protein
MFYINKLTCLLGVKKACLVILSVCLLGGGQIFSPTLVYAIVEKDVFLGDSVQDKIEKDKKKIEVLKKLIRSKNSKIEDAYILKNIRDYFDKSLGKLGLNPVVEESVKDEVDIQIAAYWDAFLKVYLADKSIAGARKKLDLISNTKAKETAEKKIKLEEETLKKDIREVKKVLDQGVEKIIKKLKGIKEGDINFKKALSLYMNKPLHLLSGVAQRNLEHLNLAEIILFKNDSEKDIQRKIEKNTYALGWDVDYAVPTVPALAALGLSPTDVPTPRSPREFVSALTNAQDKNGNFQRSVAFESSLLNLGGRKVSLKDYNSGWGSRLAYRTRISAAFTEGQEDSDPSNRLALGLVFTPFDASDPRGKDKGDEENISMSQCLAKEVRGIYGGPGTSEEKQDRVEKLVGVLSKSNGRGGKVKNEVTERCRERLKKNWLGKRWSVGLAPKWISKTGDTDSFEFSGLGVWSSLSIGFKEFTNQILDLDKDNLFRLDNNNFQLVMHARYLLDEDTPDPNQEGAFFSRDTFVAGAKLQTGFKDWRISFEGTYNDEDGKTMTSDKFFQYAALFERKIQDDIWLEFSLGNQEGREIQDDNVFGLVNLKWAFTEGQRSNLFFLDD